MAEEKKEGKEQKHCCCEGDKCSCKCKKYFPHNWFKLKCLTHIFNAFFYLGAILSIYVLVQLIAGLSHMSWADIKMNLDQVMQVVTMLLLIVVSTFFMLAVAKICKALRKIKHILKEGCKDKPAK